MAAAVRDAAADEASGALPDVAAAAAAAVLETLTLAAVMDWTTVWAAVDSIKAVGKTFPLGCIELSVLFDSIEPTDCVECGGVVEVVIDDGAATDAAATDAAGLVSKKSVLSIGPSAP